MKKNQQVLLAKKLIFYQAMTEKEKKDFLESIQTMFKPKIKEIRPEEELMYTLTRQRELGRRKKRGVPVLINMLLGVKIKEERKM